jgi:hypothetical protein
MANARNLSTMAQGASTAGILAGTYGGTGASLSPTTAGNVIFTADGSVWSSTQKIVQGTSVATTSGTAIGFTGIPSWVKRITISLNEVRTNAASSFIIQIGSGSYVTTGYAGSTGYISQTSAAGGNNGASNGFFVGAFSVSTQTLSATIVLNNITGNVWGCSTVSTRNSGTTAQNGVTSGSFTPRTLSGALDRVQLTTTATTDVFAAGSINIMYE